MKLTPHYGNIRIVLLKLTFQHGYIRDSEAFPMRHDIHGNNRQENNEDGYCGDGADAC